MARLSKVGLCRMGDMQAQRSSPFRISGQTRLGARSLRSLFEAALERLFSLDELGRIYAELPPSAGVDEFLGLTLAKLGLSYESHGALNQIPATGRLLVVANHPFGAVEGLILAQLLRGVRPDVKVMANFLLARIPELRELFVQVDPFGGASAQRRNIGPLRAAREWLEQEGCLVIFPAGEVSHLHLIRGCVTDPAWSKGAAWLARTAAAPVAPVYFQGANSLAFQVAGLVQPRLRTALLPRELLRRQNTRIALTIGETITDKRIAAFTDDKALTDHLRLRTYLLGEKSKVMVGAAARGRDRSRKVEPLAIPVAADVLCSEIHALGESALLLKEGPFDVYLAPAQRIPNVMQEIGRLREVTFRAVGEGTGRAADVDLFDSYYEHIFVWQRERGEVVGAYRLARTDVVRRLRGERSLYTNTLFKYPESLLDSLGPALELGRSFVRQEYQRSYGALLLLWKGISQYVLRHPQYCTLFGPVSVSGDYRPLSRHLLVEFLALRHFDPRLARFVRARRPFRASVGGHELPKCIAGVADVDELSDVIAALEPDGKGVPVLLRQYLKLGGRLLAFHVDARFNHCLDGLIVVDLRAAEPTVLRRYMGNAGVAAFLDHHSRSRNEQRLAS